MQGARPAPRPVGAGQADGADRGGAEEADGADRRGAEEAGDPAGGGGHGPEGYGDHDPPEEQAAQVLVQVWIADEVKEREEHAKHGHCNSSYLELMNNNMQTGTHGVQSMV